MLNKSDNKNQALALFSVVFKDGTYFQGGTDYKETKWLDLPKEKEIKRIFYKLPNNDYITLDGYDRYFHEIEVTKDINGPRRGIINIEYAYITGVKDGVATSYRITLLSKPNDRYRLGDITVRTFKIEDFTSKKNKNNFRPMLKE